jgi:hypothetical protein
MNVKIPKDTSFKDLKPGAVFSSIRKLSGFHMKVVADGVECAVHIESGILILNVEPGYTVRHYPDAVLIPNPEHDPENDITR